MPALFFAILLVMGAFAILLPSVMFVLANLGVSPSLSTPVLAGYSLAQFIAGPIWGRLSDRIGRKPVLLLTLLGGCASYLAMTLLSNGIGGIFVTYAFAGLFAGNSSVIYAAVTDITRAHNRAAGMGVMGAGIGLAFTLGPALGAVLGGESAQSAGIAAPALASASACLVGLLLVLILFRESRGKDQNQALAQTLSPLSRLIAWAHLRGRPLLFQMSLMMFVFTLALAVMEPIMPLLVHDRHDWGPRDMGYVFAYIGLVLVVVQGGLVGRLVNRFGERGLVRAGLLAMATGLFILAYWVQEVGIFVGLTFTSVGGALFNTAMLALVSHQAADHERGLVMGVFQSMQALGRSAGPLMAGLLFQAHHTAPLLMGAVAMLVSLFWLQALYAGLAGTGAVPK